MGIKLVLVAIVLAMTVADAAAATARRHRQKAQPETQIACTILGCIPVPPQCTQTYGRTTKGIPTGFDVILCSPGVWPLK